MLLDCDTKFQEGRALADPRAKVTLLEDGQVEWRTQDILHVQAREAFERLGLYLRHKDMFGTVPPPMFIRGVGKTIEVSVYPDLPEKQICLAFEPETGAFQVAISGMDLLQACILCTTVVHLISRDMYG